jgi:hypothetical protein
MEFIVIGAIVLLVVFAIAQYNRLVRLNITVDEAFAQIEVQLKRRADLIPNLVETVKGYAAHEQSTFDAVVAARAKSTSASSVAGYLQLLRLTQISRHQQTSYLYKKSYQLLKIKFPLRASSITTMCVHSIQRLQLFLLASFLGLPKLALANSMK